MNKLEEKLNHKQKITTSYFLKQKIVTIEINIIQVAND